jgi:hypothetical protein
MDSCGGLAAVVCRCSADAVQMQCIADAGVGVPGMRGADGRHGRRHPGDGGA